MGSFSQYQCDECGKESPRVRGYSWVSPPGWWHWVSDGKRFIACSEDCAWAKTRKDLGLVGWSKLETRGAVEEWEKRMREAGDD